MLWANKVISLSKKTGPDWNSVNLFFLNSASFWDSHIDKAVDLGFNTARFIHTVQTFDFLIQIVVSFDQCCNLTLVTV